MSLDAAVRTLIDNAIAERLGRIEDGLAALQRVTVDHGDLIRALRPTAAPVPPAGPVAPAEPDDPPHTYRLGRGQSVRWQGAVWAITAEGKITRNGGPATDPDLTGDVVMLGVDEVGRLVHRNARGERRYFNGGAHWPLIMIEAVGVPAIGISAEAGLAKA